MISTNLPYLLLIVTLISATRAEADDSSALVGKSFSTRSSVSVVFKNGGTYTSHIHESYSAEQQRAKLDYQVIKATNNKALRDIKPEQGSITYEPKTNTLLLFDSNSLKCRETNLEELANIFRLETPDQEPELVADDYIIGPARLLFFIDKHAHEMKLETLDTPLLIRNIPAQAYSFKYKTKYDTIDFKVLYSTDSLTANSRTTPISIYMIFEGAMKGESEQIALVVDYFKFEIIESINAAGVDRVETWFDPFMIEPATSCSQALASKAIDIFGDKIQSDVRCSFKANFDVGKFPFSAYVSYDARSNILRYDLVDPKGTSGVKRQLFNLNQNKMYHVMERLSNSATEIDKILGLGLDADSTRQCLSANILSSRPVKDIRPFSLGKLLVGSDKFVYMGRAQVNGIDVKVYETHSGGLPFWFEQPIVYRSNRDNNDNSLHVRNPETGLLKSNINIQYTVLLYFAERDENHPLVMIELYKMDSVKSITWSKQTIKINNFVWDLDYRTAEGDNMEQLFSLQDVCSSSSQSENYYAKVKLLLESASVDSETVLSKSDVANNNIRYLSLLAAIQETFNLPAQMIYDLESRILKPHNSVVSAGKTNKLLVAATFRVSEQVEDSVELVYLGQGKYNRLYKGEPVNNLIRSFQACFFLAAHRKANIYFGYNPATKRCIVILEAITTGDESNKPSCFDLKPKEEMEIYRINHVKDKEPNYWIRRMFYSRSKLEYLGSKIKLEGLSNELTNGIHSIDFIVKHYDVDESEYKRSISTGDKVEKNEYQIKTNKIDGYGLIIGEYENKRVSPASLSSYNWNPLSGDLGDKSSAMTLQQCQAACAANLNCKSYSICLRDYELECIISSSSSFRSPDVIKQIEENGRVAKRGDRVSVILNGIDHIKTDIIKNPTCELYNMNFMDLFKKGVSMTFYATFINRRIYPVKDLEECARLCVERNLLIWRNDIAQSGNVVSKFDLKSEESKSSFLKTYMSHLKEFGEQINKAFHYLDRTKLQTLPKDIIDKFQNRVLEIDKIDERLVEGYCIVGDRLNEKDRQVLDENNKYDPQVMDEYAPLDKYWFKFDLFYEKQHGVKLLATPMSIKQFEAYRMAFSDDNDDDSYYILKQMIEEGDNFQETLYFDEIECARICFTQSWGPWPACRSFDITIELKNDEYVSTCTLNSITLRQAVSTNRLDLIDDDTTKTDVLQVYHFEPRPGLALDESYLNTKLEIIEGEITFKQRGNKKSSYRIGGFGTFFIFLLALTGGILVGIKLGQKLHEKIDQNGGFGGVSMFQRDRDSLVRRTSKIEFNNIVNDEEVVR